MHPLYSIFGKALTRGKETAECGSPENHHFFTIIKIKNMNMILSHWTPAPQRVLTGLMWETTASTPSTYCTSHHFLCINKNNNHMQWLTMSPNFQLEFLQGFNLQNNHTRLAVMWSSFYIQEGRWYDSSRGQGVLPMPEAEDSMSPTLQAGENSWQPAHWAVGPTTETCHYHIFRCEDQGPFLSWLQPQAGTDAIYSCYMNQILKTYFFQCEFLSDSNVNQLYFNKNFNYKVNK